MRQSQHSKNRSRNRGRRQPNPANRSFESNGPDVKIRGSAQHIADKYLQLARDAQVAGNIVTAENYFQHAEHYLRIVAQAQAQAAQRRNPGDENAPAQNRKPEQAPASERQDASAPHQGDSDKEKAQDKDKGDEWDGPQPDFLTRPAGETDSEPKPRRAQRTRKAAARSKANGEAGESGEATAADKPSADADMALEGHGGDAETTTG